MTTRVKAEKSNNFGILDRGTADALQFAKCLAESDLVVQTCYSDPATQDAETIESPV